MSRDCTMDSVVAGEHLRTKCAVSSSVPPLLLGGVNVQSDRKNLLNANSKGAVCIDWLTGSFPFGYVVEVIAYFEDLFGVKSEFKDFGFYAYDKSSVIESHGCRVFYDSSIERSSRLHGGRATLCLPATSLKVIDGYQLHAVLCYLRNKVGFVASRIDTTFDDFRFLIDPFGVEDHAIMGNYTGFRTFDAKHGYTSDTLTDSRCNFGKRGKEGSGRYLRCYNKYLESKGEINSIRWEVEFSKDVANAVFYRLCDATETDYADLVGRYVGGSIDFIDRSKSRQACRAPRLSFWSDILKCIGQCSVKVSQSFTDIPKSIAWVENSVGSSLAMLKRAMGDLEFNSWLDGLIVSKSRILNDKRKFLADDWRNRFDLDAVPF